MTHDGTCWRGRDGTNELRRISDDALTVNERAILAMWDNGRSVTEIVAAIGMSEKTVRWVVTLYDDRLNLAEVQDLRDANVQFVARLRRVHGALIGLRA